VADGPGERGVPTQRRAVDEEAPHTRRRVAVLHPGRVAALRRPDPGRSRADPHRGVGEPRLQRERADLGLQQRTERVCGRAAEQLEGVGTGQGAQQRGRAVAPVALEHVERGCGRPVLPRAEIRQPGRGTVRAQQPAAEPVVHPAQAVRVVELGGEHRRDPQRQHVPPALVGQPPHDVEDGQVGVRP
jgi:hypothetical protein